MTLDDLREADRIRRSLDSITGALDQGKRFDEAMECEVNALSDDMNMENLMTEVKVEIGEFRTWLEMLKADRERRLKALGIQL